MKGSSGTVLSSKIRPPEKTFFSSLVVIIIGGPMKLRTFVGPKGPFTDGQRWKLVFVLQKSQHQAILVGRLCQSLVASTSSAMLLASIV